MEEKKDKNTQENQKIIDEVEKLKKRDKFLKIILIILIFIVIIFSIIIYIVYINYKKFSKTVEETITNVEQEIKIEDLKQQTQIISSSISFENSSLSKIGTLPKDIIETVSKSENIKNVEEIVEDYYNDPAINQFIEKFKNDPEIKEIFELPPKERPIKMFKKMNDPKFMQKITKEFLSNPELMKSFMKMGTDPRIQHMIQNISSTDFDNISKTSEEPKNKKTKK